MEENADSEANYRESFKAQRVVIYNKVLPYADKLDEEASRLFKDIKTNLIKAVLAREMRPGIGLWTHRLNKYIKVYGFNFSKEDHIALVKLYYELLIIPDLEPTRVNSFATTLFKLLKKKHMLSRDDLQLEWKPLFDMCFRIVEKNKSDIGMYKYFGSLESSIITTVRCCRIYFPASSTKEILDEFRPRLCPFNNVEAANAIHNLEAFLPMHMKPEEHAISCNLWLPELMAFWDVCNNSGSFDNSMAWMAARLASAAIGHIDWEPYTPAMFVRFLRSLQLPVAFKQKRSCKKFKIDAAPIAIFIVATLNGDKTSTFYHFEKFMQTLHSYFYSANVGSWTEKLKELLFKLCYYFTQRLHVERYKKKTWENPIPEEFKLTEADIDRFIEILKPCLEQAIFTRMGFQDVSLSINYLASLRPHSIIPFILEKLYVSTDSLTEPHKLTSCLVASIAVARHTVRGAKNGYPEGPTHVIPLLMALLPGIDPNDSKKSFLTFNFISHYIQMIPVVNSSEAANYYDDLTEEEHTICESSATFEDFILQFFDRLMIWVESNSLDFVRLEQIASNSDQTRNVLESFSEGAVSSLITIVLHQCSSEIFSAALKKMFNFVTNRILETQVSGKLVAIMCQCFVKVKPKEALKMFVPHLCEAVETIISENPSILEEEHVDAEFLYVFQILAELVDGRGDLVPYMDRLCGILDKTLHMVSLAGSRYATRMLNIMITSLSYIVPSDHKCTSKNIDSPLSEYLPIREWGRLYKVEDVEVSWYVPEVTEIDCVQMLINKYLVPEIETLEKYASGETELTRANLKTSLKIIFNILEAQTVLPYWEEPAIKLLDSVFEPWTFDLTIGNGLFVQMPDGRNIRKVVADTLHKVQRQLLEIDEGDTDSISCVISIYSLLVLNKTKGILDFDSQWKSFTMLKKLGEDRLKQDKLHYRRLHIARALLQQVLRVENRNQSFTETHKQILLDLFTLSVTRYAENRKKSQRELFSIINAYPYSYNVLIPCIQEILQLNTEENHEKFKGCLFLLLGPKNSPIVTRQDWQYICNVWPLLIQSMPSEKISIVSLMSHIGDTIHRNLPTIAINLVIPGSCLEKAESLGKLMAIDLTRFDEYKQNGEQKLKMTSELNLKAYNELIDKLLESCTCKTLHWRHLELALKMIRHLVHFDVKYNPKVVKFFLECLIDESITIRKIALRVSLFAAIQSKPSFKKTKIDPFSFSGEPKRDNLPPGIRPDNLWLLYDSKTAPRCSKDWDAPRFVHEYHVGYYCWPKDVYVYEPADKQNTANKRLNDLTEQEKEIYNFFIDSQNVKQLIKYFSLEDKKGKDTFNAFRFLFFKYIFKTFEDEILDNFVEELETLVSDKQESSQRCAAELMSGIIKGSKHWSFDKVEAMWSRLLPLLDTAICNMPEESIHDWGISIAMSLESRDPNRYHRILEFVMDDPLKDSTSFLSCIRLQLLIAAISLQPWRNAEIMLRLLNYFKPHLSHPFQNIRDKIGTCMSIVFAQDTVFPDGLQMDTVRMKDFFREIMPELTALYNYTLTKAGKEVQCSDTDMEIDSGNSIAVQSLDSDDTKENRMRLFKIVARCVTYSIVKSKVNFSIMIEYYQLLPLACLLQSNTVDEEISPLCVNLMAVLSHSVTPGKIMPEALDIITKAAKCPYWSARAVATEFMSTFIFYNMAAILAKPEWVAQIQESILGLLEDIQPEVRIAASEVLSGLLHCHFLSSPDDLLILFKQKAKSPIPKKGNGPSANGVIRVRHAGVLGLCAFINCHPYDVPDYLPGIFGQLGPHLNDPQPIPSTIRKTLSNFKRTHHINWEEHKLKFTENELMVLSDLTVPPSYYA